jgi:hypothetical protein
MERTLQSSVQELHNFIVLTGFILGILWWTEEVASAQNEVELSMLRVYGLDLGEQVADGAYR